MGSKVARLCATYFNHLQSVNNLHLACYKTTKPGQPFGRPGIVYIKRGAILAKKIELCRLTSNAAIALALFIPNLHIPLCQLFQILQTHVSPSNLSNLDEFTRTAAVQRAPLPLSYVITIRQVLMHIISHKLSIRTSQKSAFCAILNNYIISFIYS